jgi:crossover junction endodeoxyribonuclease RusA
MVNITLPYPPSVNTYWGFSGHRRFLGKQRLEMTVVLYPPDKRVRDIDNVLKPTIDALCQAHIFNDDSQIDVLFVRRAEVVKGGKCVVSIEVLPS